MFAFLNSFLVNLKLFPINLFSNQPSLAYEGTLNCQRACAILAAHPPVAVFPGQTGNFEFWDNKQAEVTPACRVEPSSTSELSYILDTVIESHCHFAVKSGGHERSAGASNAGGGITIDLVRLNTIEIADDRQSVTIGSGLRWSDVYYALEKEHLMVLGGRVSDVGVGGLLLGGGISFFSNARGLACDSIINYELVLPNTTIVNVSKDSHPELYKAMRGAGQMNFGIVSSFTLEAFPLTHGIWSGTKVFSGEGLQDLLKANYDVATNAMRNDPHIAVMNIFICPPRRDICYGLISAQHTTHNSTEHWPAFLKRYEEMEGLPNTVQMEIAQVSSITDSYAVASPPGEYRTIYGTFTYKPCVDLEFTILKILSEETKLARNIFNFQHGVIMHPFTIGMIEKMHKHGGNAFESLNTGTSPLIVLNVAWQWDQKEDDDQAYEGYYRLMSRMEEAAKSMGVWHPYKYANYAESTQDVVGGYGRVAHLKQLQRDVDPQGIFTNGGLAGGYHKLNDVDHESNQAGTRADERLWNKEEL